VINGVESANSIVFQLKIKRIIESWRSGQTNANQSPFAKIPADFPRKTSAPLGKSGNAALFEMKSGGEAAPRARFCLQHGAARLQPLRDKNFRRPHLCIAFSRDFSAAFLSRIFVTPGRYGTALPASPLFPLTIPLNQRITCGMRAYGRKTATIPYSERVDGRGLFRPRDQALLAA